ncbi:MAG: hypothetical protein OXI72_09245 [Gemmatimonadota bacterium]|nr:hypothetical protein [Gemmatimonadota bacterium]
MRPEDRDNRAQRPYSPLLDANGFEALSPEYSSTAAALGSLHRPSPAPSIDANTAADPQRPEVEARPSADTLHPWELSKLASLELAERFDRSAALIEHGRKMRTCQHYLIFRPLVDGRWAIADTRRCRQRLCPNDALARARILRPKLYAVADGIGRHGELVFCTFKASSATPAALSKAWNRLANARPFRRHVLGYFVGLHLSQSLSPHLHAVLVVSADNERPRVPSLTRNFLYTPPELPEICRAGHALAPLSSWWLDAARACGMPSTSAHFEAVRSPFQALQYIARPCNPALVPDADLAALCALLHDIKTYRAAGIVREYWPDDGDGPDWLGGPSSSRRYGWQADLEGTPDAGYEITPT